jgi:hypothetical protein
MRLPRYLLQNMDWLEEELGGYDNDYLIVDCPGVYRTRSVIMHSYVPGQIELYTHHPFLPSLVRNLQRMGIRTCAVYLLESQFMEDRYKFFRCLGFSGFPSPLTHIVSAASSLPCLPW